MTGLKGNLPTILNRGEEKGTAIYLDLSTMIELKEDSFPLISNTGCLKDSQDGFIQEHTSICKAIVFMKCCVLPNNDIFK